MASRMQAAGFLRPDDPEHIDVLVFLMSEAEILDAHDLYGWLQMLSPEVVYQVPVQTTRLREDADRPVPRSYHSNDDRTSLEFRVRRIMESNSTWSENPFSRTRRFVSNVRVRRTDGTDLQVSSYLLLLRSRHDRDTYDMISAERRDLLGRNADGDLELRSREVLVDQARMGIAPLPFPF